MYTNQSVLADKRNVLRVTLQLRVGQPRQGCRDRTRSKLHEQAATRCDLLSGVLSEQTPLFPPWMCCFIISERALGARRVSGWYCNRKALSARCMTTGPSCVVESKQGSRLQHAVTIVGRMSQGVPQPARRSDRPSGHGEPQRLAGLSAITKVAKPKAFSRYV